jgi:anti-sigma B factor antagonist
MKITQKLEGTTLTLSLEGRLDINAAPQLEEKLKDSLTGVSCLIIDLKDLEYISSAGLRVILYAQKTMGRQGSMVIKNANEGVMDVFEMTGFDDIVTLE